jgi:hypothetical protein
VALACPASFNSQHVALKKQLVNFLCRVAFVWDLAGFQHIKALEYLGQKPRGAAADCELKGESGREREDIERDKGRRGHSEPEIHSKVYGRDYDDSRESDAVLLRLGTDQQLTP